MSDSVLAAPPDEPALRNEIVRLKKMVNALMDRAERSTSAQRSDFGMFQTAVMLEDQVRQRTAELEAAVRENEKINRALLSAKEQMAFEIDERKSAHAALEKEKDEQRVLIKQLEEAHSQLLQSEKLASIGQLAAGVAHEINNPIGFVNSNLGTLKNYVGDLLQIIGLYESADHLLAVDPALHDRIAAACDKADLDFLRSDVETLISESIEGTARVRRIVQDLRDFSRVDSHEWQWADLHAGLESTLNVVMSEIRYKADVVRQFGTLPKVECMPAQLNQVFMNMLVNAAQAIAERGTITLASGCADDQVWISIADTGKGIAPELLTRIFDPFFTTKPVGKGTGLGLSVSYGIVDKHGGRIEVDSLPGQGTTFTIWLPVRRPQQAALPALDTVSPTD
ncbi:MAG: two-component system, NtrC family, sensor kinase [Proteobacteria bacterium]|nr:two-component system, NtrC family, sensor kinase [Pseudomonadota bacterium]